MEDEKKARLEAALYLAEEPIDKDEIADVLNLGSIGFVDMLINEFTEELEDQNRGLEVIETNQGYELKVKKDHLEHVDHLAPHQDLNKGQLRTLSIIAYNAPVEQTDIVEIRGNRAYQHIKELVNRGFLSKEKDGRTAILSMTDFFLDYFDIESLEEFKRGLGEDLDTEVIGADEERIEESQKKGLEEAEEQQEASKEDSDEFSDVEEIDHEETQDHVQEEEKRDEDEEEGPPTFADKNRVL
ncbi:MAG: SMC-Scp complex subunit ScpB [Nanohaloarchaea archaeon SW_7_46_7]|nr:MAG: SMC-Scp complex subunit ScpB [Nanohaloarchaea archaeon SW_7_46_7]